MLARLTMKILLITWACDRDDVSEPQVAYRWVSEIAKRHEVFLFSVSRPDRFGCVQEQFQNLKVIEWCDVHVPKSLERFRAIVKPGYFLYFRKARSFIRKLVKEHHFDIIHHLNPFAWRYPSPAYGLGLPLIRGPLAGGLPTPGPMSGEVSEFFHPYKFLRYSDGWRKKYDSILKSSYLQTDCVLLAAPYVANLLAPLPINRFEIENELGVDDIKHCDSIKISSPWHEKIKLLFVGRVIRTKGVRDSIRSVFYMKTKEQVIFTIIGDGEDLEQCRNLIKNLNLESTILCRGWCGKEQVEQAYREADIFVFPSFREPTGGVLLEAMSYGLPCVTCDYGGPAYMVGSMSGIKIPPAKPEKFAQDIASQLDFLVENPTIRSQMGKNALNHAFNHFNWKSKMDRIDSIYQSIILN